MLDLGCGTKPYYPIFKDSVKAYYGSDIFSFRNPDFFITRESSRPDIFGDIFRLPFNSGCVDTVLCTQVLEHLEEPALAIGEIHRILKTGGFVFITCPQSYPVHDSKNDYFRFTRFGIKSLLEKNGFNVERIFRHGGFFIEQGLLFNVYFNYNLFLEGMGLSSRRVFLNMIKIFIMPLLLIINAFVNLLGILFDYIDPDVQFTHNYTVIAKKP